MLTEPGSWGRAIEAREARVGVVGLGYVGLPLVSLFTDAGFEVLGFDIDPAKVGALNAGRSYIGHVDSARVSAMRATGRFEATDDFARSAEADALLICVPTPLGEHREPDLSAVINTGRAIGRHLRRGQLVVLESTTYPGTTRDVLRPELEAGGLVAGRDFFLAYSPEREDPGNADHSAGRIPKVVGGLDPGSAAIARALYGAVVPTVVPVSSCEVAEACKILENTYRAINIALVNELKVLYDRMGIDVWEVIDAAKTKPFGFQAFYPGPGLGGHCLAGGETVRVRAAGLDTVLPFADLFDRCMRRAAPLEIGDVEVLECSDLEVLSIDPQTVETAWKPAPLLFRRRFRGIMIDVLLGGNRRLRVTDRHPMLVVEDDRLVVREARDLKPGDRVPQFNGRATGADVAAEDPRGDVEVHTGPRAYRKRGRQYTHAFNTGQAGYFSSSPELLAQADVLLQEMGFRPTLTKGKPHLRLAGQGNLRPLARLLDGEKARRLERLESAGSRPALPRTVRRWAGGTSLAVIGTIPATTDEPVYSLEVPGTHTFATSGGVFVHNCIPIDPFYLTWAARKYGEPTRFIELAGEVNTGMPAFVVGKVAEALNDRRKPVRGSRILVLGVAYKPDVDDPRESPAFELMERLRDAGAEVSYHDPHVPSLPAMRHHTIRMDSVSLTPEALAAQDCVLVCTDHSAYDWPWIVRHATLVVDTRNATRGVAEGREKIVMA